MFCSKSHCIKCINDLQENHEADRIDTVAVFYNEKFRPYKQQSKCKVFKHDFNFFMAKQKAAFPTKVWELCKMKRPGQFYTVNKLHWHFLSY